ncbi:MAG: ABC transporter permease [Arachnia propionica]|nr:MAG: ABC transporter permease [Arachnia propionica]
MFTVASLQRVVGLVVSLLVASLLIFLSTNLLPGDVAQIMLGTNASPGEAAELRQQLGLDRPLPLRYLEWLGGMLRGDLGTSMITGRSVVSQIGPRLGVTAWLVGLGMLLALLLALPMGAFAAVRRRHPSGLVVSVASQLGLAIPAFWAGMGLVVLFAVWLRVLPAGGYVPLADDPVEWARHLVLPVASLSLVQASILTRYVRSSVISVLGTDYFRTARAMGWSTLGALWRHGTRNIAISLTTVIGLQLATLLVGAIIIEQVFALPGLGSRLLQAVAQRDLVLVQGIVLLLVAAVLVINFLVDTSYRLFDPRLGQAAR